MNRVHEQENWRQRLQAEHASAGQWRDQWGFLEVRQTTTHTALPWNRIPLYLSAHSCDSC
jgi:hypothetical protein